MGSQSGASRPEARDPADHRQSFWKGTFAVPLAGQYELLVQLSGSPIAWVGQVFRHLTNTFLRGDSDNSVK